MTRGDKEDREDILALLEDIADHDQTPEEAQDELAADGVNVSAFLVVWPLDQTGHLGSKMRESDDAGTKEG